ncbi:hypothetical protein GH754_02235 [Salinibacillus xinjiangensis]|uniref:Uncharacterized protein n=3 Tax=Salinibacillus xinjiangensis TaxID=1229268 RepID=A0A6G1X2H1_9BACI|nr:hypothetical protein [Salinibacillus xinjiangensis]
MQMYEQGKDLLTIRNTIDSKYESLGVEPTPTPMPQ